MSIKIKLGVMCGLTAAALFAGALVSGVTVKADDWRTEGQKIAYDNMAAEQRYIIEHGYDDNKKDNGGEDKVEKAYKQGFYHVQNYSLNVGDRFGVTGTNAHYGSSDPNVASVDSNGNVVVNGTGSCTIDTYLQDGTLYNRVFVNVDRPANNNNNNNNNKNNNNNYWWYNPWYVPYSAPVYTAPASVNPTWIAVANNMIVAAPKNGTVNLAAGSPLFLDQNFANILKLRPDVTVNITYGYNGHMFMLTIPRGYNLTSKLNAAGYQDFVTLSQIVDGKIRCSLVY